MWLFSLLLLIGFLFVSLLKNDFAIIDSDVNSWAVMIQTGSFTVIAKGIQVAFETESLLAVTLLVAAFLLARHRWKEGALLLGAMGGDALLVEVVKFLVRSPRPTNMMVFEAGFSFPSGHATSSVVFFSFLSGISLKSINRGAHVEVGELDMSEARIVEFYDTMKRVEEEIQDIQRRLTDIQNTLKQIQEW